MDLVVGIIFVLILIIAVWWITIVDNTDNISGVDFLDIDENFNLYPNDFWFRDARGLAGGLANNPYWYFIYDRSGKLIYTNREVPEERQLEETVPGEVIQAWSTGQAEILVPPSQRLSSSPGRYWAQRVNQELDQRVIRVVSFQTR